MGIKNNFLISRLIANLLGILFISTFIFFYEILSINTGLISVFLSDFLNQYIYENMQSPTIEILINVFIFFVGIILIFISFLKKFKYVVLPFKIFKLLKFIRYFSFIFSLFKFSKITKLEPQKIKVSLLLETYIKRNESNFSKLKPNKEKK